MRAPIPHLPSRNVRNKKTRSPGFISGDHWVTCDRCGCAVRQSESRVTWEGYVVCLDDWEPRHPQDFVRAKQDRIAPEGNVRPQPNDVYISDLYPGEVVYRFAVAGLAIPGYAVTGTSPSTVPSGTFTITL